MDDGRARLLGTARPLAVAYDVAMLDLDGVVYVGPHAVPHVPEHLEAARAHGMRLAYVTNNASRPPATVASHLRDLGVSSTDDDVVTSAQAAARLLAEQIAPGAQVFVIGGRGLEEALRAEGLVPTQDLTDQVDAVVSGYHPDLRWHTVIDGAILVRRGVPWVASNTDRTVPTPAGPGPGNGVLVKAVADYAERSPVVAGKPHPHLFHETLRRVGGTRPLVVGDRLDTDIEGANRAGYDSLLVLTGVTDLPALVRAAPHERPTYLAPTLAALDQPQPAVSVGTDAPHSAAAGGWVVTVADGRLVVGGDGDVADWWRCVAVTAWHHLDTTGTPLDTTSTLPPVEG